MPAPLLGVVAPGDRWLLAFTIATVVVLVGGAIARRAARSAGSSGRAEPDGRRGRRAGAAGRAESNGRRGLRRRTGALLVVGPVVGFLVAPLAGRDGALAAGGAIALAAFGALTERDRQRRWPVLAVALGAAVVAAAAGLRFGPTGVPTLDVLGAVAVVWGATVAVHGFGNVDGLAPGVGVASALGLLALAAFAHDHGPANVSAGLLGACLAFLAFNVRPASLFAGRAGRLAVGFVLGVIALAVEPAVGPPATVIVPLLLLAAPLLDIAVAGLDRVRRGLPLLEHRRDHLVDRLGAWDATKGEAVLIVVLLQLVCSVLAVLAGRGLLRVEIAAALGLIGMLVLGSYAMRAPTQGLAPSGAGRLAAWALAGVVLVAGVCVVPAALAVPGVAELMQDGRRDAADGLGAARDGEVLAARSAFGSAADSFERAADRLDSRALDGGLAVPGLAPNLRAARVLARVGRDLARTGSDVAVSVDPDALAVEGGRVPLGEVTRVTPELHRGARALHDALGRLDDVADEPYLLPPVRDAVARVRRELAPAAAEARRGAAAAALAPAIFGGRGDRRYLLVVQNNAEARATGGLIGSYGVLTAVDGKVDVSRLRRTGEWNRAVAAAGDLRYVAPADYRRRYGEYLPGSNLQNTNLSPDFPTVARVLESLAPAAGVGRVDGVLAVDPKGLAALLALTGPVRVPDWPTEITADNVVDVTLRDAYQAFARTPERADFLGDVAERVVDEATSGRLGKPAQIARVLGRAAHEGHLALAFRRPSEQRLARRLGVASAMPRRRADSVQLTGSNAAGNKIDYYLDRALVYDVALRPAADGASAAAGARVSVQLDNGAPAEGLPRIVAGPYEGTPGRSRPGESVTFLSLYSPLALRSASLDGRPIELTAGRELGRRVYSTFVATLPRGQSLVEARLAGRVPLHGGWYELDLPRQPSLRPDRVRVSIEVPDGWRIAAAPGLRPVSDRRVAGTFDLTEARRVRVRVVADPPTLGVWDRLRLGT